MSYHAEGYSVMFGEESDGLAWALREIGADRVQQKSDTGEQGGFFSMVNYMSLSRLPAGTEGPQASPPVRRSAFPEMCYHCPATTALATRTMSICLSRD